jgi:hypothetical protein
VDFTLISDAVSVAGLICRGGFHPRPDDAVPGAGGTLVLVGNAGPAMWRAFTAQVSQKDRQGLPDPLDTWIRRTLMDVAGRLGAEPLFPFDGPPFLPFSQWAKRAEPVFTSPMGPLIHPEFGVWHAYRGALVFAEVLTLPAREERASPCDQCEDRPCLRTCPVHALSDGEYNVGACIDHLKTPAGMDCMMLSCRARRACPIGRRYQYEPDQSMLHMRGFFRQKAEAD